MPGIKRDKDAERLAKKRAAQDQLVKAVKSELRAMNKLVQIIIEASSSKFVQLLVHGDIKKAVDDMQIIIGGLSKLIESIATLEYSAGDDLNVRTNNIVAALKNLKQLTDLVLAQEVFDGTRRTLIQYGLITGLALNTLQMVHNSPTQRILKKLHQIYEALSVVRWIAWGLANTNTKYMLNAIAKMDDIRKFTVEMGAVIESINGMITLFSSLPILNKLGLVRLIGLDLLLQRYLEVSEGISQKDTTPLTDAALVVQKVLDGVQNFRELVNRLTELTEGLAKTRLGPTTHVRMMSLSTLIDEVIDVLEHISNSTTDFASITNSVKQTKDAFNTLVEIANAAGKFGNILGLIKGLLQNPNKRLEKLETFLFGDGKTNGLIQLIQRIDQEKVLKNKKVLDSLKSLQSVVNRLNLMIATLMLFSAELMLFALVDKILIASIGRFEKTLDKFIGLINKLSNYKERNIKKAIKTLGLIEVVVLEIAMLVGVLAPLTVILAIFDVFIGPVLLLAVFGFVCIMNWMGRLLTRLHTVEILIGLFELGLILLGVSALALIVLLVAHMAMSMQNAFIPILKMLGMMLLLGLAAIALGALGAALASVGVLEIIIGGILAFALMFGAILILVLELKLIEMMNFGPESAERIKGNVQLVIDTALSIIGAIMGAVVGGPNEDGSQPKWYETLIRGVLRGAGMFISAILAVHILAATLVAVTLITFTVALLRILQEVNLDPVSIKDNVRTVIDTVLDIVKLLFEPRDVDGEVKENPKWYDSVLGSLEGIGRLLEAILAVPFLALAFVAVSLILLMATELRLLQEIRLDPEAIRKGVQNVINAAYLVVDCIFGPVEESDQANPKPWYKTLFEYSLGPILHLLEAILASAFLAFTLVAVSLVLLLATELRLLQNFEFNKEKIKDNVRKIIDCAYTVINCIYGPDDESEDANPKSWWKTFLDWALGPIAPIITAVLAIAFVGLTMIAVGMVMLLAKQLQSIQNIELDSESIQKKVQDIIACGRSVIDAILQPAETPTQKEGGWMIKFIRWAFPSFADIIDAIRASTLLLVIGFAVSTVRWLAESLELIQKVDVDTETIGNKVQNLINCAIQVKTTLLDSGVKLSKSEIKSLKSLSHMVEDFGKTLGRYEEVGKALESLGQLNLGDTSNVENVVNSIFRHIDLLTNYLNTDNVQYLNNAAVKRFSVAQTLFKRVNDIWAPLKEISALDISEISKSTGNLNAMIKPMDTLTRVISAMPKNTSKQSHSLHVLIQQLDKFETVTGKFGDKQKQAIDNYVKFIDKIKSLNIEKLQTTAKMFEHMAEFSKSISGNFDGLADSLNEKIAPLLEELKELLEQLPQHVDQNAATVSQSISANSNVVMTESQAQEQAARENPGADEATVQRVAEQRMAEQARAQARGIEGKLDEVLDILKGNGQRIPVQL